MDVNDHDAFGQILPTSKVSDVPANEKTHWLIENLWLENACGIIGGQPKCCKSWLGLDIAVSVASGTPSLGLFRANQTGRALVFMAEDNIADVLLRVKNIAESRGLEINDLNVHLITSPTLFLDSHEDQEKLDATIKRFCPKVVLLDPLVRLHRLDENNAKEISGLLGFIRGLQRKHNTAIIITHHATKRGSRRPGQALRGSSDIRAFGDSNLYLSRRGDEIDLAMEHRSAASPDAVRLVLAGSPQPHLAIAQKNEGDKTNKVSLEKRIIELLSENKTTPLSRATIRQTLKANNQRIGNSLAELEASGKVVCSQAGYTLT
jgi:hypothetical protein